MEKQQTYLEKAEIWAQNSYFDEPDRKEIQELLKNPETNKQELLERFSKDLEFGTGGLRSILGVGSNRMNKYNVRRATQALSNILKKYFNEPSVVISFDSRKFSPEFAKEVACVFAANEIRAYIFSELTPTPILSFAIRKLNAQSGVMVTASHNPKNYNGYKAYWNDGAQVTPPYDKEIIQEYNRIDDWNFVKSTNYETAYQKGFIKTVPESVLEEYYQTLKKYCFNFEMCNLHGSKVHLVYTPLHGTGFKPAQTIAKRLGFTHFEMVEEQSKPDSNFSTVKSPNPEDPIALEMAVNIMLDKKADAVFGTDPDGDRLGVVINHQNKAFYLNGNQIAIIMLEYILKTRKSQGTLSKNSLVIKSIVTSELQRKICDKFNVRIIDTLTGFKWMAQAIREEETKNSDFQFIFASEESFGYMPFSEIRDKDGIASIALMSEIILYYKLQNKNLVQVLDDISNQYGFALEGLLSLDYLGLEGQNKIERIMNYFRNNYNKVFSDVHVIEKIDFLSLEKFNLKNQQMTNFKMEKSNVLGFTFENGDKIYLRPSGTEPKIKFYFMFSDNNGDLNTKKRNTENKINHFKELIKSTCEKI